MAIGYLDAYQPRKYPPAPDSWEQFSRQSEEDRKRCTREYTDQKTRAGSMLERTPEIAQYEYQVRRIDMENQLDLIDLLNDLAETGDREYEQQLRAKINEFKHAIHVNRYGHLPKAAREIQNML